MVVACNVKPYHPTPPKEPRLRGSNKAHKGRLRPVRAYFGLYVGLFGSLSLASFGVWDEGLDRFSL